MMKCVRCGWTGTSPAASIVHWHGQHRPMLMCPTCCEMRSTLEEPRKVKLPQRYALMEPHDTRSGEWEMEEKANGPWLLRHDVIAALKAAGVEIETDDKKGTK